MELVVMIPAYNEESTIGNLIRSIPRDVLDEVKVLVINDGSTDNTLVEAEKVGADKIISFKENRGLAVTFEKGLDTALQMGADIIVNIDADGQYDPREIPKLVKPIEDGQADIVLGSRFKGSIEYMPKSKKIGNILATKVTGYLSGIPISDAQTGFRAFSKYAALRLNVLSEYTYVQETIIQAAYKGLTIMEVPCTFSRRTEGKSRLITNIFGYARRSSITILRTYINYKSLKTFFAIGGILSITGIAIGLRVLIHFIMTGRVTPYLPSAILTAVLLIIGFQIMVLGLIADMVGNNRKLTEEILYNLKKRDLENRLKQSQPSGQ
ncbi:glycosyl transferase family 2 [Candidatus Bathyarchaeota archaeon RBG_13_38_9]|nr:MAG: glycosyl transferase family 2 [Candidatus Bathyarchaeota archaeon RBG_13_38_9]